MTTQLQKQIEKIPTGLGSTARRALAAFAFFADEEGIGRTNYRTVRMRSGLEGFRFMEALACLKEDGYIKTFDDGSYEINMEKIERK